LIFSVRYCTHTPSSDPLILHVGDETLQGVGFQNGTDTSR